MAFPTSPTNNQTAIVNGIVYLYSSADNAWTRFSSPPGNLTVTSNLTSSGNLIASNVYLSSLFWSNGTPISLGYGNTQVAAYLTTGTVAITDLSVGDSLVQQDALNLNNNNLYGVNTIRINDPGTSEGIAWEGGSGWNIYESPDDLSNNTGNLQIVLSGTRVFTVDTNQTVNIPSTWASKSTTSGALTVAGGVGIGGNLWVGGDIYASNLISIGSTTLTVTDPLLYLAASDLVPYNYDIGFYSHFIGGSLGRYQHTGFSRNSADNTWTLFSNVTTEPGATIAWTEANIIYDPIKVGSANIANTTISTSTTTGALVVAGGVGIGGALHIVNTGDVSANIGAYQIYANTNAAAQTTSIDTINANIGAYQIYANANIGSYQIYANANAAAQTSSLDAINANIGAFYTYANNKIGTNTNSNLVIQSTAQSTSAITGALVVAGGVGVAGNIYSADRIYTTTGLYWSSNNAVYGGTPGGSDTQVQFNDGGSTFGADSTFTFDKTSKVLSTPLLAVTQSSGDEGGEILLAKAATNTTLAGTGVTIDVYQNRLRIFEQGGTSRGYYLDISSGGAGISTNLISGGGGGGTPAGSSGDVQFNNGGAFGATSLFYDSGTGNLVVTDTTISSSTTTGALVIKGGVGVAGTINVGGNITVGNVISSVYYSAGSASKFELTDIGLVTVDVAGTQYKFGASGIEASPGIFGGSYGGNKLSLNNETALISNRYDTVTIQTGTDGSAQNTWTFGNSALTAPGRITALGNIVAAATTTSTSTTTGALVVLGGVGVAGNVVADKLYTTQGLYWAGNGVAFSSSSYGNTEVAAYLPIYSGNVQAGNANILTSLSVASGSSNTDVLNLNNNNLYNVNTIRISDPGTSEGIIWEGGSGWSIYESPDDLSNDIGNLQIVLNSTRTLTVTTDGTINIPSAATAISTTTGALTVGGGVGVAGNVYADAIYTTTGIKWAGNGVAFSSGGGGGITYTSDTTPPGTPAIGDQWYNTATDVLYEYLEDGTSSYWVDVQSLGTSTGNAVAVSLDDITLSGNLILTANLVYSIGGDTGRLRSIYAGNIISRTANVDTINTGSIAATGNVTAAKVTTTGNITAANVTTTGNVQGNYMLGDGSKLTNINAATTGKAIAMAIVFGG